MGIIYRYCIHSYGDVSTCRFNRLVRNAFDTNTVRRFGMLIKPYSKIFIPGLAFVIGTIALIELINHVRHHGEEQFMTLFWVEFDTTSFMPWVLFCYDSCRVLYLKYLCKRSC